jgi:hypothetical protein
MGWKEPTRIQAEAIPHALQGTTIHPWRTAAPVPIATAGLIRFGFLREGPYRTGADGVGEDGRLRAAYPAGAAQEPRRPAVFLRLRPVTNEVGLFSQIQFGVRVVADHATVLCPPGSWRFRLRSSSRRSDQLLVCNAQW